MKRVNTLGSGTLFHIIMTTNNITIRPIHAGDENAVADIWFRGLSQTADANWFFLRPILRSKMDQYGKEALSETGDMGPMGSKLIESWSRPDRAMFVACLVSDPDSIVGVIGVKRGASATDEEPDSTLASIWKMSVDDSVRRQGVGKALLQAAEEHARTHLQCQTLVLMTANPIAGDFYEKACGFVRIPAANWYESFHPISFILRRYRKEL